MKTIKTFISVKKVADLKLFKIDHKRYSKILIVQAKSSYSDGNAIS